MPTRSRTEAAPIQRPGDAVPLTNRLHIIVCFGRLAEVCVLYCSKGRRVYVEGKLRTRDYDVDGVRRYMTEIVAETVKLLQAREKAADVANGAVAVEKRA